MQKFEYTMVLPGVVEISDLFNFGGRKIRLDLKSAKESLKFVKSDKNSYITEEAWIKQIEKFSGAVIFLENYK